MCGIFGLIDKAKNKVDQSVLIKAVDSLRHRGPDHQQVLQERNIGLAHCRLKVIDLSDASNQPFQKHNCLLVFNGVIYNYLEIRNVLISEGYTFSTLSDTEVLLSAYDFWGTDCVTHFRGMWAFGIYDFNKNKLTLSRDQASIKPLYYSDNDQKFGFSSGIRAMIDSDIIEPIYNPQAIYEFIEYGLHDHNEYTFFKRLKRLKGGNNLIYDLNTNSFEIKEFSSIYKNISIQNDPVDQFSSIFKESLELVSRADIPFASCLSGGLDSSSIVCGLSQNNLVNNDFKTFSACFDNYKFDEREFVDAASYKANTKNIKVFPKGDNFINSLKSLIELQEEPVAGAGVYSQYTVAKTAKNEGLKVLIDGQGGDELLAGYDVFYPIFLKEIFKQNPISGFREVLSFILNYKDSIGSAWSRFRNRKNKSRVTKAPWFTEDIAINEINTNISSVADLSRSLLKDMGLPALLRYADKNMMHFGIEGRYPFLDQKLVAFCLKLDASHKIKNGLRKSILRESMQSVLPEKIQNRKDKLGFATPQEQWIKENKSQYNSLYKEALNLPFVDKSSFIESSNPNKIWRLINVKIWMDIFNLSPPLKG